MAGRLAGRLILMFLLDTNAIAELRKVIVVEALEIGLLLAERRDKDAGGAAARLVRADCFANVFHTNFP